MKLTRWSPSNDLLSLHNEVDRMFDAFFGSPTGAPAATGEGRLWRPAVDVRETPEEFAVRVDLPGVDRKDIKVSVFGDTLTVRGERREASEQKDVSWLRVERYHGSFERQFQLGTAVQGDKVSAVYKDGVLEVRIPKAEAARPKEIPVQVSAS